MNIVVASVHSRKHRPNWVYRRPSFQAPCRTRQPARLRCQVGEGCTRGREL